MPATTHVQLLRGNTASNDAYTGLNGELTVNTDTGSLRVHDGITEGGHGITYVATVPEGQMPEKAKKDWPVGAFVVEGPGEIMFHTQRADTALDYTKGGLPELTVEHQIATMDGEPVYRCCYVGVTGDVAGGMNEFVSFDGDAVIVLSVEGTVRNLQTGEQTVISPSVFEVEKYSGGLRERHFDAKWNNQVACVFVTYIRS